KKLLAYRSICGASAGQIQSRRTRIIDTAAQTDERLSFVGWIPNDSQPWLKLLPRRRNVAVGWETGLADKRRKKHLARLSERIGFNLRVPTQAVAQRKIRLDLSFVLHE